MSIKAYWCVETNSWVRFSVAKNGVILNNTVTVAAASADNPRLTGLWENTNTDFNHGSYTLYDPIDEKRFYYLKQGRMYRVDGKNRYTGQDAIGKLTDDNDTWIQSRDKINFTEPQKPTNIPMNPEQREKQREEQLATWTTTKNQNFYTDKLASILAKIEEDFGNGFSTELNASSIKELLSKARDGINLADFETHENYFDYFHDILSNEGNTAHQNVVQFSQKTTEFHEPNIPRHKQILMKQQLFFELIAAEYNAVIDELKLGETRQKLECKRFAPPPTENTPTESHTPIATSPILSAHIEDTNSQHTHLHIESPESQASSPVAITPAPSLTSNHEQEIEPGQDKLQSLKSAVLKAQANYKDWYQHGYSLYNCSKSTRGRLANGFFTWARHGSYGQQRARNFQQNIQNQENINNVISAIEDYLTHPHTRYHRHSFASFLLDELNGIEEFEELPWKLVTCDEHGKYKKDVLTQTTSTDDNNCRV